jgi:glutathione S-transferase
MAEVELFIDFFSQPSRAVLVLCLEAEIPVKIKEIQLLKGETGGPEFKKISPMRVVPVIKHREFALWESHAILAYLATVFPKARQFFPEDPGERAKVNIYLHWHHLNLRYGCGVFIYKSFIRPLFSKSPFPKDQEEEMVLIQTRSLQYLENILSQHSWVAKTSEVTIADFSCFCELEQMKVIKFDFNKYPKIREWQEKLRKRPGVRKAHEKLNGFLEIPKI